MSNLFLIGGCDGARPGRNYFHDLAMATPSDSLILTPEVLGVLVDSFDIRPTGDAREDLERMLIAA